MSFLSTLAQAGTSYGNQEMYYTLPSGETFSAYDLLGATIVIGLLVSFFGIILYVVVALFLSRIFKKAGLPAWVAWVPIYNNWKLLEIGGQQGFWAILSIIPPVGIVSAIFMYISMYNIGLKLGKEGIFILLGIFLTPVWLIWLAVDSSVWDESKGAPSLAEGTRPPLTPHHPAAPAA